MGSIFRITRAEFVKTFKRPTIYIMAFVLLITAVITTFIFNPETRTEDRISYSSSTSSVDVYSAFNGSAPNSKIDLDVIVDKTNTKINYFTNFKNREKGITKAFNDLIDSYHKLVNDNAELENYKQAITYFKDAIEDKYGLDSVAFINDSYNKTFYQEYSNYLNTYKLECDSAEAVITGYANIDPTTGLNQYDRLLNLKNNAINIVHNRINYDISNAETAHKALFKMYFDGDITSDAANISKQNGYLITIRDNLQDIYDFVNNMFDSQYEVVYMQTEDFKQLDQLKTDLVNLINATKDSTVIATRKANIEYIATHSFISQLKQINKDLIPINLDDATLKQLDNAQNKITLDLATIVQNIETVKNLDDVEPIKQYVSDYSIMTKVYRQYVNDTILLNSTSEISYSKILTLKGPDYKDYNYYQIKERQALNLYKINNNDSGQTSLNPLAFNQNSDYETNGYDYMFYTISIMSVLIIIFSIMMTAITVGSEQDSGTIKLLLVRPFKRTQILLSKLLSVFFFVVTFSLFAFAVCAIAALFMYGLPNANVLVVFNASIVFKIHPLLLLAIFTAGMIFQIYFYSAFAFLLSVLFRNFATGLVSSLIVYLGGITCNILLATSVAFKWIPFTNSYLYRYFGGAFLNTSNNQLNNIFASPIYSNMGFIWSIVMCTAVILVLHVISLITFKKRDF